MLLLYLDKVEIFQQTWNEIKKKTVESCFDENRRLSKLEEILRSKGQNGRNLLHTATSISKDDKLIAYVWNLILKSCKTNEEFLEILKDVDNIGNNLLYFAAAFAIIEIITFLIEGLEKCASKYMKKVLSNIGQYKRNVLQAAAQQNQSSKVHEYLWKIMEKYFDPSEILRIMNYADQDGNKLLDNVILGDQLAVIELTWNEIIKTVNSCIEDENNSAKLDEIFKSKGENGRNLLHEAAFVSKDVKCFDFLRNTICSINKDKRVFSRFMQEIDDNGNNAFYIAAALTSSEVLKFMIDELEEYAST